MQYHHDDSLRRKKKLSLFPVTRPGDYFLVYTRPQTQMHIYHFLLKAFPVVFLNLFSLSHHFFLKIQKKKKIFAASRVIIILTTRVTGNKQFFFLGLGVLTNFEAGNTMVISKFRNFENLNPGLTSYKLSKYFRLRTWGLMPSASQPLLY